MVKIQNSLADTLNGLELGHNGHWPEVLNRAAIRHLPAAQFQSTANGRFPILPMSAACPQRP